MKFLIVFFDIGRWLKSYNLWKPSSSFSTYIRTNSFIKKFSTILELQKKCLRLFDRYLKIEWMTMTSVFCLPGRRVEWWVRSLRFHFLWPTASSWSASSLSRSRHSCQKQFPRSFWKRKKILLFMFTVQFLAEKRFSVWFNNSYYDVLCNLHLTK